MDKDSLDEDENDSGFANRPANAGSNFLPSSETNGDGISSDANSATASNSLVTVRLSEKGATLMRQLTLTEATADTNEDGVLMNGELKDETALAAQLEQLQLS